VAQGYSDKKINENQKIPGLLPSLANLKRPIVMYFSKIVLVYILTQWKLTLK
jgi:hypothetical protein